ncbi:MAG: tetratricopeptide repeat protein, partial [Chloroflexota bacterium]
KGGFGIGRLAFFKKSAPFDAALSHTDRLSVFQYQDIMTYLAFCEADIGKPDASLQRFLTLETILTRGDDWEALTGDMTVLFPDDYDTSRAGLGSRARLYDTLAITHDKQDKVEEGVGYFSKALEIYNQIGDLASIANTITFAVVGHERREEWSAVVEGATHIVQIAERFKQAGQRNINTELTGVQMLANAHYRQGNLTDAAKYQTDLVTILREINHPDTEKFERILYNTTQEIHKKTSLM